MAETINVRNPYFDFLKGIAIIFVVAIHTFGVVYSYETIDLFSLLLRQIMNCAVPIFCASSAYFLSKLGTSYICCNSYDFCYSLDCKAHFKKNW